MKNLIKPGTDNQPAGKYIETGALGEAMKKPKIVNIDKGDRLQPTSQEGYKWAKKHK